MAGSDENTGATVAEVMDETARGGSGEAAAQGGAPGTRPAGGHEGGAPGQHETGAKVVEVLKDAGDAGDSAGARRQQ